jgi:hypothetical protein
MRTICALVALLAALPADAASVLDLQLGTRAADQPAGFTEFACGTRGGPPGRPLRSFADFAACRPEPGGLREVSYRLDDEPSVAALALRQPRAALRGGTRLFGKPVIASALFDEGGILRTLRIVTDPRGLDPADRNDLWALGRMLRIRYGAAGWRCSELPPAPGDRPVATFLVKAQCTKATPAAEFVVREEYLHRRGQAFTDEFGKVQPTHFHSEATFEITMPR